MIAMRGSTAATNAVDDICVEVVARPEQPCFTCLTGACPESNNIPTGIALMMGAAPPT